MKALKKIGQGIDPRYRPNARPQRFSQICVDRAQSTVERARDRETCGKSCLGVDSLALGSGEHSASLRNQKYHHLVVGIIRPNYIVDQSLG